MHRLSFSGLIFFSSFILYNLISMALHCFISISFDSIILSLNIALQLLRFDSCLASAPEKNSLYTKTSH